MLWITGPCQDLARPIHGHNDTVVDAFHEISTRYLYEFGRHESVPFARVAGSVFDRQDLAADVVALGLANAVPCRGGVTSQTVPCRASGWPCDAKLEASLRNPGRRPGGADRTRP